MADDKKQALAPNKPVPQPVIKKLTSVPFVVDGFTFDHAPRIWKSKPSKTNPNPTRVGANLGAALLRIAGSSITYSVPMGILFEMAGSEPTPRINMPSDDSYIPQPLFKSDDPAAAADMDRFVSDTGTKFYAWYAANHADKIPLATVDHKWLSDRVGVSASAPVTIRPVVVPETPAAA